MLWIVIFLLEITESHTARFRNNLLNYSINVVRKEEIGLLALCGRKYHSCECKFISFFFLLFHIKPKGMSCINKRYVGVLLEWIMQQIYIMGRVSWIVPNLIFIEWTVYRLRSLREGWQQQQLWTFRAKNWHLEINHGIPGNFLLALIRNSASLVRSRSLIPVSSGSGLPRMFLLMYLYLGGSC